MKTSTFVLSLLLYPVQVFAGQPPPVIDMHVHAFSMEELPPGTPACPGDQHVLVPTIDPGEEIDFSKFTT